jgi:putative hydrolase of the HAD superfamily
LSKSDGGTPEMTFLYDIGNVLLKLRFDRAEARLFPNPPADMAQRKQLVEAAVVELETGRIGPDTFIDRAIGSLGFTGSRDEFRQAWCDLFDPLEPMWECVHRLAATNHRLILFSNTNDIHMDHAFARYPVFELFPEAVFSHRVGAMKPDNAFYQYAIDTYRLDPADTVYIDDRAENIEAGKRFGWHCWQYDFNEHEAFLHWLEVERRLP